VAIKPDCTHYCSAFVDKLVSIPCLSWQGNYDGPTEKLSIFDADFDDTLHTVWCTFDESLVTCPKCLSELKELNKCDT
jgi:hypothetical protein